MVVLLHEAGMRVAFSLTRSDTMGPYIPTVGQIDKIMKIDLVEEVGIYGAGGYFVILYMKTNEWHRIGEIKEEISKVLNEEGG